MLLTQKKIKHKEGKKRAKCPLFSAFILDKSIKMRYYKLKGVDKMPLTIEYVDKNTLKPYENNAKIHTDEQIQQIINSITQFGFNDPIAVWKDNEIIEGHGRLLAALQMPSVGDVPIIRLDSLTDEQRKAYILAHNKLTMNTGFDFDILTKELDSITDLDMSDFGFDLNDLDVGSPANADEDAGEGGETPYTSKIEGLQYEPSAEKPLLSDLFDKQKTNELIDKIKAANVSDEEKDFLITAASRHTVFDYAKIADYYAHADAEMQSLMEQSALVIIDFEDAIKNGYARLSDEIATMYMEDTES